jgi:hypothetical protein
MADAASGFEVDDAYHLPVVTNYRCGYLGARLRTGFDVSRIALHVINDLPAPVLDDPADDAAAGGEKVFAYGLRRVAAGLQLENDMAPRVYYADDGGGIIIQLF